MERRRSARSTEIAPEGCRLQAAGEWQMAIPLVCEQTFDYSLLMQYH